MPAATTQPAARTEKEEQLWSALKRHIMRERQRKKQEQEAEVEEERLRKEREARERQDVMTLGETREQIKLLDNKLEDLKNEKKQLFLQLKRVLNEDDVRKRQLLESNEIFAIHGIPQQATASHVQLLFPPRTPHQQTVVPKNGPPIIQTSQVLKRGRSPSPPPPGYYKTNTPQYHPQAPNEYFQYGRKMEDGRRGGEVARAVLWNKPPQYTHNPGTLFYPNQSNQQAPQDGRGQSIIYPTYAPKITPIINYVEVMPPNVPFVGDVAAVLQAAKQLDKNGQQGGPPQVFHINLDQPIRDGLQRPPQMPPNHMTHKQHQEMQMDKMADLGGYHPQMKHDDRKDVRLTQHNMGHQQLPPQSHLSDGIVYTSSSIRPMPLHSTVMAMAPNHQHNPKSGGSITQGYANRPQNVPPPQQQIPQPQMHHQRHRY